MSEKNRISVHSPLSVSFSESPNGDTTGTILGADTDRDIKTRKVPALKISCTGAFIVAASMLCSCSARNGSLTGSAPQANAIQANAIQANARFAADRSLQNSWSKSPSYQLAHHSEKAISERVRGGSILIARPAPQVNVMYAAAGSSRLSGSEPRMLGFAPTSANDKDTNDIDIVSQQLVATINRKASTVNISGIDSPGLVYQLGDSVPSGAYKVGLIQRNPRWYAPDAYYTRRNLKVPPAGSAPRFLKGALGIGAIFLQPLNALNTLLQIPLHCAKEYTEDVGGVQVPEETYLELQRAVELGKTVVIE